MSRSCAALLFLGVLISCGGAETRDVHDYSIDDYTRRLDDPDYRPERPRRRRGSEDDLLPVARHELLFRRASLYQREARTGGHHPLKLGLSDMDESIRLVGDRAGHRHYSLRAFLRAASVLEAGATWRDSGENLKREVLSSLDRESLRMAVADYTQALVLAKEWDERADTFAGRGAVYYALGETELAAADYYMLQKVQQKQKGVAKKARTIPWERLEQLYGELRAEAARTEKKDQEKYFADLERLAAAEASAWRSAAQQESLAAPEESRRAGEAEKAAEAKAKRAAMERAYANRQTCANCKGSGQVTAYDPGTAHNWKAKDVGKGVAKWTFEGGRDSKWGQGSCPNCYGRGFTLPGIDD